MKLKYERFEGLGCLYVRGALDDRFVKLLKVGVETIGKDLEETLIVNLTLANIPESFSVDLADFKIISAQSNKQKIYWISKNRDFGDYPTIDALVSRMPGAKSRQIGERIKADDELYQMTLKMQALQSRLKELGGDDDSIVKLINENSSLKEQKRILELIQKYQNIRSKLQIVQPYQLEDTPAKIEETINTIRTYFGKELDL